MIAALRSNWRSTHDKSHVSGALARGKDGVIVNGSYGEVGAAYGELSVPAVGELEGASEGDGDLPLSCF